MGDPYVVSVNDELNPGRLAGEGGGSQRGSREKSAAGHDIEDTAGADGQEVGAAWRGLRRGRRPLLQLVGDYAK